MIKHFETTGFILVWCFVIAGIWGVLSFYSNFFLGFRKKKKHIFFLPTMVIAPVFILIAYRGFRLNLFYPISLEATTLDLITSSFIPAVILLAASGLFKTLSKNIIEETEIWKSKLFTKVATAYGMSEIAQIRRLVLLKSFSDAFSQCLPWLFGELIICEVIFNAPGLGLEAWHHAKMRNISGLAFALSSIAVLYISCLYITTRINSWIGRRLSSYV